MKKIGSIIIEVYEKENGNGEVNTAIHSQDEFKTIMMAAEFLSHLTAQKSKAGYEQALELIRKGAMTYRTQEVNET